MQIFDYSNKTVSGDLDIHGLIQSSSLNPITGSASTIIIQESEQKQVSEHISEHISEQVSVPAIIQTIIQTITKPSDQQTTQTTTQTNETFSIDSTEIIFTHYDLMLLGIIFAFIFYLFFTK
jgi:hypothetical protein